MWSDTYNIEDFEELFLDAYSELKVTSIIGKESYEGEFDGDYPSLKFSTKGGGYISMDCYPGCCGKVVLNNMNSTNKTQVTKDMRAAIKIAEEMEFGSVEYSCISSQYAILNYLKSSSKFRRTSVIKGRSGNEIYTYVHEINKVKK